MKDKHLKRNKQNSKLNILLISFKTHLTDKLIYGVIIYMYVCVALIPFICHDSNCINSYNGIAELMAFMPHETLQCSLGGPQGLIRNGCLVKKKFDFFPLNTDFCEGERE